VTRLLLALICLLGASAEAAEPRPPHGRPAEGPEPRAGREPAPDPGGRHDRRDIEGGGASGADVRSIMELTREEKMLELEWRAGGCGIDDHKEFVKRLLALENQTQLMSLEVWGDTHEYTPYQRVYYYMRVPRAAYVTLFWIGPKLDVFVPFQNLRIPADRDVRIDPDSIVVPPLGREQWVAVATLEPLQLDCQVDEANHLGWLAKLDAIPHGVGRWEVRSKPTRSK